MGSPPCSALPGPRGRLQSLAQGPRPQELLLELPFPRLWASPVPGAEVALLGRVLWDPFDFGAGILPLLQALET